MNYIKVAIRIQARYKWFTLINITGLSLGIICSMIIFLFVNAHFATDSYHPGIDRIYRLVLNIQPPNGITEYEEGTSLPMAKTLQEEHSQVEMTAFCMKFYSTPTITIHGQGKSDKYKEDNAVAYADNHFIELFEHTFIAGDKHTALQDPKSVILSERQALKYFGTVDVIGRLININHNTDLTVTGIFADQLKNSDLKFDVLVSLPTLKVLNPKYQDQNFTWIGSNNWTFIKLKDGVSADNMERQLPAFVKKHLGPDFNHWQLHLQPLADIHFDTRYDGIINKVILWVLAGVAVALICIVCVNYINLSIAQSGHRAREIGIRKYLGGSRMQLFLQFMSETGLVVIISIGTALAGSYLLLPVINRWLQADLTLMQFVTPGKITAFLFFGIGLILLAGYYPAVILSGFDPIRAIAGKAGKITGTNQVLRKSLICFQYAVALLFLISTFIIIGQVNFLLKTDLGFSREEIITVNVPKSGLSKLSTFRDAIENIPGVGAASLHNQAPMAASVDGGFIKYDNRTQWEDFIVRDRWADDRFIDTYSLDLVAGRNIRLRDSITEVIVNESLLRKLNISEPDEALGKNILFDNSAISGTIVGVVRDFHHRSLQNEIEPLAIYPFYNVFNQVGVRFLAGKGNHALADIETVWKKNFPDDVMSFSFLDQSISKMYRAEQTTGRLMSVFAIVSIVICCIGILGLSVFSALQRTKEIGIRKVLGATALSIVFMLCKQYLVLITIAIMIAVPVGYMLIHQWLETFAYHISLTWLTFLIPGAFMLIITIALVGAQSLKTALANPTESLKHE
jgi:putative ABC transport system permease protein